MVIICRFGQSAAKLLKEIISYGEGSETRWIWEAMLSKV